MYYCMNVLRRSCIDVFWHGCMYALIVLCMGCINLFMYECMNALIRACNTLGAVCASCVFRYVSCLFVLRMMCVCFACCMCV